VILTGVQQQNTCTVASLGLNAKFVRYKILSADSLLNERQESFVGEDDTGSGVLYLQFSAVQLIQVC
jgi:hypothetical protein